MEYLIGYYQSWNSYTKCKISDIKPKLYTHLIYAFVGIKNHKIRINDQWGDVDSGGFKSFNALKERNRDLKTLLAVGGWEEGSKSFSEMARTAETRRTFIKSCIKFCEKYGFDGIDLDWEYPAHRGGIPEDKHNFKRLVREMSAEFEEQGLFLSVAVGAGKEVMEKAYDVPEISRHVDFINLMTYDMHSASHAVEKGVTGHNAPVYSKCGHNVRSSVKAWLEAGAEPQKLILGIPAYGRSYVLDDPKQTHIGAPASKAGDPESVGYDEVLKRIHEGWKQQWDSHQKASYIYHQRDWIGYDDPHMVKRKVELARKYGLGGVMLYSIDTDSPCVSPKFPLTKAINEEL